MSGDAVAKARRALSRRPDAQRLLHRLGAIAQKGGLVFTVSAYTAAAWWAGDVFEQAILEIRVDRVAEWLECDVTAVAPDGTPLYRRMTT